MYCYYYSPQLSLRKLCAEPGPSRGGWFSLAALKRRGRPTDDANAQPRTVSIATLHALVQPHEATAAAKAGTAATSQVPEKPGPQLPPMPVVEASKTAEPAAAKPAEGVKRKRGRPRKQPVPTVISDEVANLAATMAADTIPLPSTQALHTEPATALTSQAIPSSTAAGKPRASAAVGALQPEVHGKAQVAAGRKTKPPSLSPSSLSSPAPAVASANKAPMPESQMLDHVRALAAAMHSKYVKNPSATPQVDTAGQTPTTSAATTALQPTQGDTAAKQTPTQDATSGPTPGSTAAVHDPAQGTASKPTKGDTAVGKKPTHGAVSKPTPGASAARQKPMPGTNSSGHKASKAGSSIKAGTSWIMLDQAAQTEALQGALHGVAEQHKADALSSQAAASSVLTSSQTPAGSDSAAQQPQPAEKRRQSQQVGALQPRPASAELPVGKLIEAVSRKDKGKHKAPLPLESATDPLSDNAADEVIDLQQEEAAAPTTAADVAGQAARQAAAAAAHSLLNDLNTKKRRGRPPKDPMKLAAALAAYAAPRAAAAAAAAHAASEAADAEIIAEAAAQAGLDVVEQYTQRYKAQQADDNRPVAFALPSTKTAKAKKKQMQAVAAASSAAQAVRDVEPQPTTASLEPLPVGTQLSNGFEATIASMDTTPAQTGPVVQKPKKKRGRPPKAVMQAAIRAADTSDVPIDPVAQAASSAPVASSAAAPLAPAAPDQTHALGATPSVHGTAGTAAAAQDAADVAMPDADSMHHLGDTAGPALAAQPVAQLPSEDAPATEQDNMPAAAAASEKPAAKKSTRKPRTKQKHLEALSSRAMALLDTLAPVSNDADLAQLNPQTQSPPQTDSQPQTQPQQTVAGAALRGIQTQAQAGASAQASDTHSDLDIPPQSGYYSGSPAKDATLSDNRHSDASETLSPADPVDMHLDTDAGDLAVGFGDMSPSRSELAEQPAGALIAMHLEDDPAQPMLELNASPPHAAPGAMNGEDVDAGQQPLTTADTAVQQVPVYLRFTKITEFLLLALWIFRTIFSVACVSKLSNRSGEAAACLGLVTTLLVSFLLSVHL